MSSLCAEHVARHHAQNTKIAVLNVLAQPNFLLLIIDSIDSERKLAGEDTTRPVGHEQLRASDGHERHIVINTQTTADDGRVDALLKLSLRHVVILLAHDPTLGRSRGTEAVQKSEETGGHVVDGRVGNDENFVRRVTPSGGVRTVGTEGLANTTRVKGQLIVDSSIVEVVAQPLVAGLGVVAKDVEELSNEHVGGSKLDLVQCESRGVRRSHSSDAESLYGLWLVPSGSNKGVKIAYAQ